MKTGGVAAALLGLGSTVYAQIAKTCPSTDVCYSLSVPSNTASSGNGDIFFQLTAPTSYSWVALGQGSSMSGANIFVMYTDASGSNVTLSPRLGTGHSMPQYNSAAQVTLLEGTGVSNNIMTANVRCSNCKSWSGGSMDFTSSSASWIFAAKSGSSLKSGDTNAAISQHGSQGSFSFDLSKAKGGSDVNPFTGSSAAAATACSGGSASGTAASGGSASSTLASPSGTGCPTSWPSAYSTAWPSSRPSQYASCFASGYGGSWPTSAPLKAKRDTANSCSNGGSTSSSTNGASFGSFGNYGSYAGLAERGQHVLIAHGVMAALAFVILFPAGAISIRLLSFPGLIWFHAALQILAYVIFIVAFGMGVWMAVYLRMLDQTHVIIGIVLFVVLFFQPILGILHHLGFKKYSRRTYWSHGHLWLGRAIITLGIVNGGLGLQLAGNAPRGLVAYAVIGTIVWVAYVAAIVWGEVRRKRRLAGAPPPYAKEGHQLGSMEDAREVGRGGAQRDVYR
ncbi:hypothetical protein LTR50_006409 [Elasticomyces elasticus]|nr:hypothetical protein LTR50_006409 [Elasticomyces elasticus]